MTNCANQRFLSLGQNLPPDWGCIPKQPDSLKAPHGAIGSERNGALTLSSDPFQGTCARSAAEDASPYYNLDIDDARFSSWALPGSLVVTKGVLSHLTWGRVESVNPLRGRRLEGHAGVRRGDIDVETRHREWIIHHSVATTSVEDSNLSHPHDGAHGRPKASGATCVQRFGGSRDPAIHTKYRISLRSSSMRELRYLLPRVVVSNTTRMLHPPHADAGVRGRRIHFKFLGVTFAWFDILGIDNDPFAGSPTETLLRLLLPLNDKVQWSSRDVAHRELPTSQRSEHFTGPFNQYERRAVCTKGTDVGNAS
uniref:Uncharacterized protein n=1 Tax=Cucumis sativus TaxID=3659 RepID=A0A0A0L1K6_CUCSA